MPAKSPEFADAFPRKRFFVEMFTRDIALEDCILDLVDNSIDALIRSRKIDLEKEILRDRNGARPATVTVTVSPREVSVEDDCGGIPIEKARHEVFNFGHSKGGVKDLTERGLGAYGIGLKRAIFKMGKFFRVDSSHNGDSFRVEQDLTEWVKKDATIDDWRFPLTELPANKLNCPRNGTKIEVTELGDNIKQLAKSDVFIDGLNRAIARTYAFFLAKYVNVEINGDSVKPIPVPVAEAAGYEPASETYPDDGVRVRLIAGLAPRGPKGAWQMDRAGWYVLCNGRVVVSADKTSLTGWGAGILPQFHSSKGRGFVGLALFASDDPQKLPWTTTKRGLNREAAVYLRARNKMQSVARPVYSYLESLYPSGEDATTDERDAAKELEQAPAKSLFQDLKSRFKPPRSRKTSESVSIQFGVPRRQVEAVREHLDAPNMSASEVGRHTFKYFMENEEIE